MASRTSATPLAAIEAVVLDTETTSLDVAKARIVQIGAVRVGGGRIEEDAPFDRLVNPGEPIPEASTRVHRISTTDVAAERSFADLQGDLGKFIGTRMVIGHSIGFDLAVWRNELRRAGQKWHNPRALDTRLLAEIANPKLPGFSLETVAAWLNIEVAEERHSAIYDAVLTAKVFFALVPYLRAREIRTVAEAESACRKLTDSLTRQHQAGWVEPVRAPQGERSLAKIDSYPYRHRVREVMSSPPLIEDSAKSLAEVVAIMAERRVSSIFLADRFNPRDRAPLVGDVGIVTERDVLRAVARAGGDALARPVAEFMTRPIAVVPIDAFLYRAIGRMARMKIRHLGVLGTDGRLAGALSQRDLLRMRAEEAISLGDEIDCAANDIELAAAWSKLPTVAASLMAEGIAAHDVSGVISRELGALTRRAGQLAEARLVEEGRGRAPVAYSLLTLGSGGRGESLLASDQDNALVYAEGEPGGDIDQWFERYCEYTADILNAAGLPYCSGGVMARNPQWRGSLDTWRERIGTWVRRSRPEDLLSVDIFFDARVVHGDPTIGESLLVEAFDRAGEATDFAKLLAETAGDMRPPLTFLGGIKTVEGRVDLKVGGMLPVVSAARVLAIRHHVVARATADRLAGIRALGLGGDADLAHLADDHRLMMRLMLEQQLDDVEAGIPTSSRVAVKRLDREATDELKAAFGRIGHSGELTRSLLVSRKSG